MRVRIIQSKAYLCGECLYGYEAVKADDGCVVVPWCGSRHGLLDCLARANAKEGGNRYVVVEDCGMWKVKGQEDLEREYYKRYHLS